MGEDEVRWRMDIDHRFGGRMQIMRTLISALAWYRMVSVWGGVRMTIRRTIWVGIR
jgi:hypothetical protein